MEKLFLSWQDIHGYIKHLHLQLKEYKPLYITGIPRGGLIPAVMLSHLMEVEYISFHIAEQMDDSVRRRIVLLDDISDSGTTLSMCRQFNFITVSLITRYNSSFIPVCTANELNDDRWVVFPWEKREAKTIQGYLEFTD